MSDQHPSSAERPLEPADWVDGTGEAGQGGVPAVVPPQRPPAPIPPHVTHTTRRWVLLLLVAAGAGGGALWVRAHRAPPLPGWIAWSNGRLEADEVDISTKFAGRVAEVLADEGSVVRAGQVVARMDVRDMQASLAAALAQVEQTRHTAEAAQSNLVSQSAQMQLAAQELQRAKTLVPRGFETQQVLDQRQAAFNSAQSAVAQAQAQVNAAQSAQSAAERNADLLRINIADNTLTAPKNGPIEYRLANIGEVLPSGGKVFTMLDMDYVYMDVFLPTAEAGQVRLGAPARIVLDAAPDTKLPASVVFVASQNQFTPKAVETKSERDKLMFRVRVRLDASALAGQGQAIRAGAPGLAYISLDPSQPWPALLALPGGA